MPVRERYFAHMNAIGEVTRAIDGFVPKAKVHTLTNKFAKLKVRRT